MISKLEIGKVYKFLKRLEKFTTNVFEAEMFDYAVENKEIYPGIKYIDSIDLKCPVIFTVVDICPHTCKAYDKEYYCYKILVTDTMYTKFIHPNKENYIEQIC